MFALGFSELLYSHVLFSCVRFLKLIEIILKLDSNGADFERRRDYAREDVHA